MKTAPDKSVTLPHRLQPISTVDIRQSKLHQRPIHRHYTTTLLKHDPHHWESSTTPTHLSMWPNNWNLNFLVIPSINNPFRSFPTLASIWPNYPLAPKGQIFLVCSWVRLFKVHKNWANLWFLFLVFFRWSFNSWVICDLALFCLCCRCGI